jgi:hypothetical protein
MHRSTLVRVALVVVALATITGAAYAAIPSGSGVISACKRNDGTIKLIDKEAGQSCTGSQQLVEWGEQGPVGPQGPQGPAGAPGDQIGWVSIASDGSSYAAQSPFEIQGVSRLGTGRYEVDFVASMAFCNRWATIAGVPRMVAIGHMSGDPTRIRVTTYDAAGTPVDTSVMVSVTC